MSRLHKKCLLGSAFTHGALLLVLLVGPAFFSRKIQPPGEILEVIPAELIDGAVAGGGSPAPPVVQPEPPAPIRTQPPPVETVTPPKPAPVVEKAPEQPAVKPNVETVPLPDSKKKKNDAPSPAADAEKKRSIQPSFEVVKRNSNQRPANQTAEQQRREAAERSQRLAQFNQRISNLREGLSSSTSVEMPGSGPGLGLYADYTSAIQTLFYRAWVAPEETEDDQPPVKVKIVVTRDGSITSKSIVNRSGNATLDKSVQKALDRVDSLPPFPAGSKDAERTFIINFNLKARRQIG